MVTRPERKSLVLKRREDRRLRRGHPWVFSNEVDTTKTPLDGFQPGDLGGLTHALLGIRREDSPTIG